MEKTTTAYQIPVIFHIIVTSTQLTQMGGYTGIQARVDSQIAVINRDFNRGNGDSTLIPAGFKSVYSGTGIKFAKAVLSPGDTCVSGYNLRIITSQGFSGINQSFGLAKHNSTGGLDAWDPTKYLNVWVINFNDPSAPGVIGITVPPSFVGGGGFAQSEEGICVTYGAFGVKTNATGYFVPNITGGRTLTHELGHFFEIWHVWGDDGGLCPNNGGADDGISDTPPQADATYGNPSLPQYDACTATGNGIMCMNYMDYTDDDAMHMFTRLQAGVMAANVASGGESYTLTQHPELLVCPTTGVAQVSGETDFAIAPNPTTGAVTIRFGQASDKLQTITVMDMMGRKVQAINAEAGKTTYNASLNGLPKGIYFVNCHFENTDVTRKIVLE